MRAYVAYQYIRLKYYTGVENNFALNSYLEKEYLCLANYS